MSSSIKPIIGTCKKSGCGYNGPLIGGMCSTHYWQSRAEIKAGKTDSNTKKSTIPPKSAKQLQRDIQYAQLRKVWIKDHAACAAKLTGCTAIATQVHHMQGREGPLLLDVAKWLPVCHRCHTWITEHSAEAIQVGLSISRNKKQ